MFIHANINCASGWGFVSEFLGVICMIIAFGGDLVSCEELHF